MKWETKDVRKITRLILTIFGSIFLGMILHELYHYFTLHNIEQVCLVFGDNTVAYVRGSGESNEIVAYVIEVTVSLIGFAFAIYDLFKE